MKNNKLHKLLYKSFETDITPAEKKILEQGLAIYPELHEVKDEVSEIRNDIRNFGKENFSANFEAGLLYKANTICHKKEVHSRIQDAISMAFKEVSLSGAIVLALLFLYNLNAGNNNIIKDFLGSPPAAIEYSAYDPAEKLMWTNAK